MNSGYFLWNSLGYFSILLTSLTSLSSMCSSYMVNMSHTVSQNEGFTVLKSSSDSPMVTGGSSDSAAIILSRLIGTDSHVSGSTTALGWCRCRGQVKVWEGRDSKRMVNTRVMTNRGKYFYCYLTE